MKLSKNLVTLAASLLASAPVADAGINLYWKTVARYRQNPNEVYFVPGDISTYYVSSGASGLSIRIADGDWVIDGCPQNGSGVWFPPAPLAGCPLGATGFLLAGDRGNDFIRDDYTYWEIVSILPAVGIHPNRPDLCYLQSAPPSELPRPVGNWQDFTGSIYYNLMTDYVTEYKVTDYYLEMPFTSRGSFEANLKTGQYKLRFPRLNNPTYPIDIPVQYYPIPEGRMKQNYVWSGFSFEKKNNVTLRYGSTPAYGEGAAWSNGFVNMDPRVANTFHWIGNTPDAIFPANDTLSIVLLQKAGADPAVDSLNGLSDFPGFTGAPSESRVILPNALVTQATVPPIPRFMPSSPGYMPTGSLPSDVYNPATSTSGLPTHGVFRVTLSRQVLTSAVAGDYSTRFYDLPVAYVNTYAGWAAVAFVVGTSASVRDPMANPDGDAFLNWQEWVNNTDPNKFTTGSPAPVLTYVPDRAVRSTGSTGQGTWQITQAKAAGAPSSLYHYTYEFSTDLQNWATVTADNPDWVVVETGDSITIQSTKSQLTGKGFIRMKMEEVPETTAY